MTWPTANVATVSLTLHAVSYDGPGPVQGAVVHACAKTDDTCANPLAHATTDGNGDATLTGIPVKPYPFDGYFELLADGYVPSLSFFYPYIVASNSAANPAVSSNVLTASDLELVYTSASTTYDPGFGSLVLVPFDCEGFGAPGVSFAESPSDPAAVPFYFADGLPSTSVTSTQPSGPLIAGGFLHATPGRVTIVSSENGVAFSSATILVRAGTLTTVIPVPTPQ